jgi:hypothetical protein
MNELRERGIAATRQLAKRQITWLRSTPQRQVVACDAPDAVEQVLAQVTQFLKLSAFDPAVHGGEVMTGPPIGLEVFRFDCL